MWGTDLMALLLFRGASLACLLLILTVPKSVGNIF